MRIGLHVPVSGGLVNAARHARSLRCECIQIFARNARGWRARTYREDEVAEFRTILAKADISPLVIHSCYLVNLASPDKALRERSVQSVADDMARASLLGGQPVLRSEGAPLLRRVAFVSSHFGHRTAGFSLPLGTAGFSLPLPSPAAPLRTLAASIRSLLADAPPGIQLLLENSAGCRAGSPNPAFGADWSDFARLFDLLHGDERVGVCFDTCHAHAAGHRVDSARWIGRTLREFDRVIGLSRLRLIHLNDSRGEAGSHIDRHQHIGRGAIGDAGFRALLRRRDLRVPQASVCGVQAKACATRCAILETPIDRPGDDRRNLTRARMLRGGMGTGSPGRLGVPVPVRTRA